MTMHLSTNHPSIDKLSLTMRINSHSATMIDKLKAIPILLALWIVNGIFRFISVETAWNLGECLGSLCHKIMPKRRAIIAHNMAVVSKARPEIEATTELTKQIFQRCCANLVCSIKTYGMTPEQLTPHIELQSCPEYDQAVRTNSGAILCLAHMGNWEVLSKVSSLMQPEPKNFGAIYRPLDSKAADSYVANQRKKYNCQMFPKSTPMGTLSTFIREGGVLGILADQRSGKRKKNGRPFFGVESARSKLPAVLHLRTAAPLFNVSVSSPSPGKWRITIAAVPTLSEKLTTDEVVTQITQGYEHSFSENLLDVFWLHRYWNTQRAR